MQERGDELIAGLDDSNHAGDSKGEIIVATFSRLKDDGIVRKFPNKRDYNETKKWIDSLDRDYRFTVLTAERYRHSHSNLVYVCSNLIFSYLSGKKVPNHLKIFFDGKLPQKNERENLKDIFVNMGVEKVILDSFIKKNKNKKGNFSKRIHAPSVVYHADVLANTLYSTKTFEELSKDERMVHIN